MKTAIIIAILAGTTAAPFAEAQVKREKRFERLDNRTDRLERRGAWEQGSYADFAEDRFDRFEDRIDRRESRRDEAVDFGRRDVIEDRFDRAENVFDRRENRWDRHRTAPLTPPARRRRVTGSRSHRPSPGSGCHLC